MQDRYKAHIDLLPEHMRDGMLRWIERGIKPGSFLTAVLQGDLFEALGQADDINRHKLFDYGAYLYNCAPSGCFGSPEKVNEWRLAGGLDGFKAETEGAAS